MASKDNMLSTTTAVASIHTAIANGGSSSVEANKAALRRVVEATTTGDLAVVDEVFAPDVVLHDLPPGAPAGSDGVKAAIAGFRAAFDNPEASLDVLVAEDDRVVGRVTLSGMHTGEFMGVPATGERVTWSAVDIARFAGGRVVEVWRVSDTLGLLQQLGAIRTPPAESADAGPSPDELKAAFQRYIDVLWNEGRLEEADEMFSPDYIAHMPADPGRERGRGPEVIKQYVSIFRSAFPDLKVELHALVAEGNEVAARGVVTGTFQGELFGIPPTGARASWTLTGFDRFDETGRITDGWGDMDMLGALQKLGVIPAPGEVPTSARQDQAA
jgi:predicted ester cyclase